jgi:hypothetical protein
MGNPGYDVSEVTLSGQLRFIDNLTVFRESYSPHGQTSKTKFLMAGFSRAGLRDIKQSAQRNRLGRASHLATLLCQEREASWASKLPESKCVLFYFSQNTLVDNSGVANRDGENSPRRYGSLRVFLQPRTRAKVCSLHD